jgi:uroporphyrinogen III methyltransferase/synthase
MGVGKVYLIGAGPGDPDLITLKGLERLKKADVVVYDRLVDESILNYAKSASEKIYVGKTTNHHSWDQERINQLLVQKALEGKIVVRLKGGDPFVFGRGGEEAYYLSKNGIPFEVVPGISSAIAVPAYAGIPVTHRGISSSFIVLTGHKASIKGESSNISWESYSLNADTLIILMGLGNLSNVVEGLLKNNKSPTTPVAVITEGSTSRQRCVVGTLRDIVEKVKNENLNPPSVIVVGEVVNLRKHLRWFDISVNES